MNTRLASLPPRSTRQHSASGAMSSPTNIIVPWPNAGARGGHGDLVPYKKCPLGRLHGQAYYLSLRMDTVFELSYFRLNSYSFNLLTQEEQNYRGSCLRLKLPTLKYRRLRGNMIEILKITHDIYDPDALSPSTSKSRSQDLHKYFVSQRILDTWNSLPAKPDDFSSLARFTRFVRSIDLFRLTFLIGY